jgi:hypothetical protein
VRACTGGDVVLCRGRHWRPSRRCGYHTYRGIVVCRRPGRIMDGRGQNGRASTRNMAWPSSRANMSRRGAPLAPKWRLWGSGFVRWPGRHHPCASSLFQQPTLHAAIAEADTTVTRPLDCNRCWCLRCHLSWAQVVTPTWRLACCCDVRQAFERMWERGGAAIGSRSHDMVQTGFPHARGHKACDACCGVRAAAGYTRAPHEGCVLADAHVAVVSRWCRQMWQSPLPRTGSHGAMPHRDRAWRTFAVCAMRSCMASCRWKSRMLWWRRWSL